MEKEASTYIEHAVESAFQSIHGNARKAAEGGIIRPKHVVLGAKKALTGPFFAIAMEGLVETIISCACEGELKLNIGRLIKWLKSVGLMMNGGRRTPRIDPRATLSLGTFQKGSAIAVLDKSIMNARADGKFVIGKGDISWLLLPKINP